VAGGFFAQRVHGTAEVLVGGAGEFADDEFSSTERFRFG
jgi:hypothetical protein